MPLVHTIQTVDSLRLAEELDIQAARISRRMPVFLQVNASEEAETNPALLPSARRCIWPSSRHTNLTFNCAA